MLKYLDWSVDELFKNASAASPEPGGGGVSAMTGCLGSGMLSMVARITAGKAKDSEEVTALINILDKNIETLKSLAQRDMDAFNGFMEVLALPKATPGEKNLREEKKLEAALESAGVPLKIAKTCLSSLQAAKTLAAIGSKYAISDVGVGVYQLQAAVHGALLMVDANLDYISDLDKVNNLLQDKERIILEVEELCRATLDVVRNRMKG